MGTFPLKWLNKWVTLDTPHVIKVNSFPAKSKKIILKNKDFTPFFMAGNLFILWNFYSKTNFVLLYWFSMGKSFINFFKKTQKCGKKVVNFIFTFLKCIPRVNHESDLQAKSQEKASKMKVWLFPFLNYL